MERYVGLDVSLKLTSICVVDQTGSIVKEGVVDSDPEAIAAFVRSKAPGTVRIGRPQRCGRHRSHHADGLV
jgi:transposase